MGRLLKGGVWSNVEDEVLKSAIMKYGTNQWARVASLINRKSANQCKARWYEWLSPTVKKTEWTIEENEKLLHLAKVFPTQWRTISDMIQRTPTQCHQQYALLTEKISTEKDGLGELSNMKQTDDVSIDIRPESRPAKPDAIDMAEDEIDMLNEARARLANTQGKKAKRKGRERQLILTRRLAQVQQTRELNEVGINASKIFQKKNKKPGINYNDEIPFYQPIPRGFADTSKEKLDIAEKVIGKRVSDLEFESREDREKRQREKDAALKRKREEENLPDVLKRSSDKSNQIKRSKLILSEPKLHDEEFQDLLKMGRERENLLASETEQGMKSTNLLISSYIAEDESLISAEPTPLSASIRQKMEIENLRSLSNIPTPLLGGENTPLHDIKALDEKARIRNAETGNSVLRSRLLGTPASESTYATPTLTNANDGVKFNMAHKRRLVEQNLTKLSKPQIDQLPNKPQLDVKSHNSLQHLKSTNKQTDQEDIDMINVELKRKEEADFFAKRSEVFRRNLPRPLEANHLIMRPDDADSLTDLQKADELVKQEMLNMIHFDLWKNPVEIEKNGKYCLISKSDKRNLAEKLALQNKEYAYVEDEIRSLDMSDLDEAEKLIEEEISVVRKEVEQHLSGAVTSDTYSKVWEECLSQLIYLPKENRYTRAGLLQKKDRIECMKYQFEMQAQHYGVLLEQVQKTENKLNTLLNGYMARSELLKKAITEVHEEKERAEIQLASLEAMRVQEQAAIKRRTESLEMDVMRQKRRESELQARFAELTKKRENAK